MRRMWDELGMNERLTELEEAADELGWKGDVGEEEAQGEEGEKVQRMMDVMMWTVTECMRVAEAEVMGEGSWSAKTKNRRFKEGWSPEMAQRWKQLRKLTQLVGAIPKAGRQRLQKMGKSYEEQFGKQDRVAKGIGTPTAEQSNFKWECWAERVKNEVKRVKGACTSKERTRLREGMGERNKKIVESIRIQKWRRVIDIVMGRERVSGDRDCLMMKKKRGEGGEEAMDVEVVTDKVRVGEELRRYFDEWMGNYKRFWHDRCILFEDSKEGRLRRLQLVNGELPREVRLKIEEQMPEECVERGVLDMHKLKYLDHMGRYVGPDLYWGRGVMKQISMQHWELYWGEKKANKASDWHEKHGNLVKALGRRKRGKGGGGKEPVSGCVFYGIRRMMNVVMVTGMVYTAWEAEVLITLMKVPGSTDVKNTRPVGLVDILRNAFMGIQFKLIVETWVEHEMLSKIQYGSLPQRGTEQARLVQVLTLEYARMMQCDIAQGTEDKRHAFDSPHKLGGYEISLMRLGIPLELIDILRRVDRRGMMMVRMHEGLSRAFERMRGTVQGGEDSPPKWVAFDDIFVTEWEKNAKFAVEVQVSEIGAVCVMGTAFVDDKKFITPVHTMSELYEMAAVVGIFHGVEMVPSKSYVQIGKYEGKEGDMRVIGKPGEEGGVEVKSYICNEKEGVWKAEHVVLPQVAPDEAMVSLGDTANVMLSWGWNIDELRVQCVKAAMAIRGGYPKEAVHRGIKMTLERRAVYKMLMSSVSEDEVYEVVKPLMMAYKDAMGIGMGTSAAVLQAFGGLDVWGSLHVERIMMFYRALLREGSLEGSLVEGAIWMMQRWDGRGDPIMELKPCKDRGWNHGLMWRVQDMMESNNLKFVGGDGMKLRRKGDRSIVDAWEEWRDEVEGEEGWLEERHAVSWGCHVLEVGMMSHLYQGDGKTVRRAVRESGEWEKRLGVEKDGDGKCDGELAREWCETMRELALWWGEERGELGGWMKAAFGKGSVVMWKGLRKGVRVGRLDDWIEGMQRDDEVKVRPMKKGEEERWEVDEMREGIMVRLSRLRMTAWTGMRYDEGGMMREAEVEDVGETWMDVSGGWDGDEGDEREKKIQECHGEIDWEGMMGVGQNVWHDDGVWNEIVREADRRKQKGEEAPGA